ncbi:MAG: sulfotransferase family protein [bacterium]
MLPNFLLLGAAKAGTTSLYRYVAQHPDIFMSPVKEPGFFIWEGREYDVQGARLERVRSRPIQDFASYAELFSGAKQERIRGEGSTGYLHTPGVAERIRQCIPGAKLIAILRDPVDRAYSAFLNARTTGIEPFSDFAQALESEPRRVRNQWIGLTLYVTVGKYGQQLERYLAVFPPEQLRVYLYEDLAREPLALVQDAFRFLEVDDAFEPDVSGRANVSRAFRSARLYGFLKSSRAGSLAQRIVPRQPARLLHRKLNERPRPGLSSESRGEFAQKFEADLHLLSRQLNRDLSPWLEGNMVPAPRDGDEYGMHPRSAGLEMR